MKTVLVVGGAGYIGSHACKALSLAGVTPVVFDNLSSGSEKAVKWGPLVRGDIRNASDVSAALRSHKPDVVMHFAARIEVGEGERDPLGFYDNNVAGVRTLLGAMMEADVRRLVFSSTCAIYGDVSSLPITEEQPKSPTSVYGRTKWMVEQMLADISKAQGLQYAALRYFNAAGADAEGEIGEEHDPETHLIPIALKAAAGLGPSLKLFGDDYPTRDGTCVRDYVHVSDLADAHVLAAQKLMSGEHSIRANLGTGEGRTVKEVLEAVEAVTGKPVPHEIHPRRQGDAIALYADPTVSRSVLGWTPRHSDIANIVSTAWNFHQRVWKL